MKRIPTLIVSATVALSAAGAAQDVQSWPDGALSAVKVEKADTRLIVSFDIDTHSFPMRANRELQITPLLTDGIDTLALPAVTIAGRTRYYQHRRAADISAPAILTRSEDPVGYSEIVDYQPWMHSARLILEGKTSGCCGTPAGSLPSMLLTSFSYETAEPEPENFLNAEELYVAPVRKEVVKTRILSGRAYIDFPVNQIGIYPDYRRNPEELAAIQATLDEIRGDKDVSITSISFKGFASPEGPYDNNVRLAKGRTEALMGYVKALYSYPDSVLHTAWEAEDWDGLKTRLADMDIPNRDAILGIIDDTSLSYDDRDRRIKQRYPDQYAYLLREVYPALRHSDYLVEFTVRNYVDITEIAEVYATNPSKLSYDELFLYAQSLDPESPDYREAMLTAATLFPSDPEANFNAGVAAAAEEDFGRALQLLRRAQQLGMEEAGELIERITDHINASASNAE